MAWFSGRKAEKFTDAAYSSNEAPATPLIDDTEQLTLNRRRRLSEYLEFRSYSRPLSTDYIELVQRVSAGSLKKVSFTDEEQIGEYLITHLVLTASPVDRSADAHIIHKAKKRLNEQTSREILKMSAHLEIDQQILYSNLGEFAKLRTTARLQHPAPAESADSSSAPDTRVQRPSQSVERSLDQILSDSHKEALFIEVRAPYRAQVPDATVQSCLDKTLKSITTTEIESPQAMRKFKDRVIYRTTKLVDKSCSPVTTSKANKPVSFIGVDHQLPTSEIMSSKHKAMLVAQLRQHISVPLEDELIAGLLSKNLDSVKLNASTSSQSAVDRFGQNMVSKTLARLKNAEAEYVAEQERRREQQRLHSRRLENRRRWQGLSHLYPVGVGAICFNKDECDWASAQLSFIIGSDAKNLAESAAFKAAAGHEFSVLDESLKQSAVRSTLDRIFSSSASPENLHPVEYLKDFERTVEESVATEVDDQLKAMLSEYIKEQEKLKIERYISLWRDYATSNPGYLGDIGRNSSLAFKAPTIRQIAGKAMIAEIRSKFDAERPLTTKTDSKAFKWAIAEIMETTVEIGGRNPEEILHEVRHQIEESLPLVFRGHLNRALVHRDALDARRMALIPRASEVLLRTVLQRRNQSTSSALWLHDDNWWEDLCRQHTGTLRLDALEGLAGAKDDLLYQTASRVIDMVAAEREADLLPARTSNAPKNFDQMSIRVPLFRSIESPREFEALSREWMMWLGYSDSTLTSNGADGGIDVIAQDGVAQVKQYASQVSSPEVQKFAGAGMIYPNKDKLFFASTRFSSNAVDFANLPSVKIALFQVITDRGRLLEPFSLFAQELLDSVHRP